MSDIRSHEILPNAGIRTCIPKLYTHASCVIVLRFFLWHKSVCLSSGIDCMQRILSEGTLDEIGYCLRKWGRHISKYRGSIVLQTDIFKIYNVCCFCVIHVAILYTVTDHVWRAFPGCYNTQFNGFCGNCVVIGYGMGRLRNYFHQRHNWWPSLSTLCYALSFRM